MKAHSKKLVFVLVVVICVGAGVCVGWSLLPITAKAGAYRAVPFGSAYSRYERLAGLLALGMPRAQVGSILGTPDTQEDLEGGQRWIFFDDGPTAGWTCVVDFSSQGGSPRLAYFFNVQHRAFANSPHHEFGSPVDGGKFQSDPVLKLRRDQWYGKARAKSVGPTGGSRCAEIVFLSQQRLPPVGHAWCWADSR